MISSLNMPPQMIEVYHLPLRDTVNEGGDEGAGAGAGVGRSQSDKALLDEVSATGVDEEAKNDTSAAKLTPLRPPIQRARSNASTDSTPRKVVLVTQPSQQDIELWTERATSKMTQSGRGGSARFRLSTQESKRWVLEYKPVVSHSGWLIKRGHSIRNFKRRLFCIIDHELVYHDSHDATEVRGRIDLSKRTSVQCLLHSGFRLSQGSYHILLYAIDTYDRDVWIKKLQERGVELIPESAKTAKLIERRTSADPNPILFSGWLLKRGQMVKSTKRRWFELSNTSLTYYSHPQGGTKKGSVEISDAKISQLDTLKTGERFSFVVRTRGRDLVLHADSQEERSLWVASLSSVAVGSGMPSESADAVAPLSSGLSATQIGRRCMCNSGSEESNLALDGSCRRCMSSFISKTEDALLDVTREVQLILASPYSPEGSTSSSFLRDNMNKPFTNAALKKFMSGLSDYMIDNRLNELRVVGGRAGPSSPASADDNDTIDDSSDFTDSIISIIYEQVEERVFYPLYREVFGQIKDQIRADSKLLRGKIEVLQSKSQSFFGIGPNSLSPSGWQSARETLKEIDKMSLPSMKRKQLVLACKEIYAVYNREHPTNGPMSADDFIPAFIYVLVQSKLIDPVFVREMMTLFDLGGTQGEAAYFVTCLEIALEYIRSLVIACTVALDASKPLGIEFSLDPRHEVGVVSALVPDGQADKSHAVNVGDVLVAINGLLVSNMDLAEISKMIAGSDGAIELCLLSMTEYVKRFGTLKRTTSGITEGTVDEESDYRSHVSASSSTH
ncbi:hypothetical protein Poli38472_003874 [Pythium oligandrum]|uniref:Uncharacterized protein n=1 Tax=Pythium oligandrum TaxID=41045 RepID=A0A8K1CN21_PYTOL|nr:hypothetical protein Poli38472_003874 [Pythium oligandrum]|eukprot:TMW66109.1 hypothetical protein Poli38472_003874 [Pythium oligandrum]